MPQGKDRKSLRITVTPSQRAVIERLCGERGLSEYIRQLLAEDAAGRGIAWPDDLNPQGVRLDYLARRLAGVHIAVADGRAAVARVDETQTVYARNWQDLEDEAVEAVEAQGGHVALSGIYECPPELAERAAW